MKGRGLCEERQEGCWVRMGGGLFRLMYVIVPYVHRGNVGF